MRRLLARDVVRHSALAFAALTIYNASSYVFQIAASHRLVVADFGLLAALLAVANVLTVPAGITLTIVARLSAEFDALGDGARVRRVVGVYGRLAAAVGALTGAVLLAARQPISGYFHTADVRPIVATAAFVAAANVVPAVKGALQGISDFRGYFVAYAMEGLGRVAFGIGGLAFGVSGALYGLTLAYVPAFAASWLLLARRLPKQAARMRQPLRRTLQTVTGVAASTACMLVLTGADVIIARHYFDRETAGVYGAVNLIGRIVFFGLSFVAQIVLPSAAGRASLGRETTPVLRRALLLTTVLGSVAVAVILPFAPVLVRIVAGAPYHDAAPFVAVYAAAMAVLAVANVAATYNIAVHDFRFLAALVPVTLGEVAALAVFHDGIRTVVAVVAAVAVLALASSIAPGLRRDSATGGQ